MPKTYIPVGKFDPDTECGYTEIEVADNVDHLPDGAAAFPTKQKALTHLGRRGTESPEYLYGPERDAAIDHVHACLLASKDWVDDCRQYHGRVLTGVHGHWCPDWDSLPLDETCGEFHLGEVDANNTRCKSCGYSKDDNEQEQT